MPNGNFVPYYRVSTTRQGESGLGLKAQQEAVTRYLNGGDWKIIEEYTEIESGKRNSRPQLQAALAACKKHRAILILAKLDRLGRNTYFISGLMESGVEFICCDMPSANRLTLHIMAAVAEDEAKRISERTSAALKVAKTRGIELGKHGREVLSVQNHQSAIDYALRMRETVNQLREGGHTTVRAITAQLNALYIPTHTGTGQWHIPQVHKLLKRLNSLPA